MRSKQIKDFDNFIIYEDGTVVNTRTGNKRSPHLDKDGYLRVTLEKDGKTTTRFIHRLLAEAFIPNPENKETVNHKDENKINNSLDNLEWMTKAENDNYGTRNKRIARVSKDNYNHKEIAMCDKITHEIIKKFDSIADALEELGKDRTNTYAISKVCKGKGLSAYGYWWKYID